MDIFDSLSSDSQGDIFDQISVDSEEQSKEEESWIKKGVQYASQVPLGLAKAFTWPADVLKAWATAEALQGMQELEEGGHPFDRDKYLEAVDAATKYFPTQELAEKGVESVTGLNLRPQGEVQEFLRGASELAGLSPGSLVKKAMGGLGGEVVETGLKTMGAPPVIAGLAGGGTAGALSSGKAIPKAIEGEAKEMRSIAQKHDLRQAPVIEREKKLLLNPSVSESRNLKLTEDIADTSKKAIDRIIDKQIPARELQKQGHDLKEIYQSSYSKMRDLASKDTSRLEMSNFNKFIDSEMEKIRASAPSPSTADEAVLKVLDRERRVGFSPITKEEIVNQYQKFNENLSGLYRKPEFIGAEKKISSAYEGMKNQLIKTIEKSGDQDLVDQFKYANKIYSETQKISKIEKLLDSAFRDGYDPKKLDTILKSERKNAFLTRDLGKEAVKDIQDIAKYGKRAEENIGKYLKINKSPFKEIEDVAARWGVFAPAILTKTALLKLAKSAPTMGLVPMWKKTAGLLLTRNSTRKDYKNYLKAISTGKDAMIKRASDQLLRSVDKEFDSVDEFFRLVSDSLRGEIEENVKDQVEKEPRGVPAPLENH